MRDFKNCASMRVRDLSMSNNPSQQLSVMEKAARGYEGQHHKLWMDRFDNVLVYSKEVFWTKLKYTHNNPVKAGLVVECAQESLVPLRCLLSYRSFRILER
jgi:hypothetical protein